MDLPAPSRSFVRRLLAWYRRNQRDLPWRQTNDPYRIWISEVMLQQTRVAAVVPYYHRFLDRFPTAHALASAAESDVLALWAGLGYYSRARNLHKAAKAISEQGTFPRDYESIRALPGVGDYTAAAVASIAFRLPHAVLDGNVARVLSRLTAEPGTISSPQTRARLLKQASETLPRAQAGEFNQALMELGAAVCLPKNPQCLLCPIASMCAARQAGKQDEFPIRASRKGMIAASQQVLIVKREGQILLWQRPADSRRLAGFWELPGPDDLPGVRLLARLGAFRHTIVQTRYVCEVWTAFARVAPDRFKWIPTAQIHEIALSTTARKALTFLEEHFH